MHNPFMPDMYRVLRPSFPHFQVGPRRRVSSQPFRHPLLQARIRGWGRLGVPQHFLGGAVEATMVQAFL
jgi:hypothetical protein